MTPKRMYEIFCEECAQEGCDSNPYWDHLTDIDKLIWGRFCRRLQRDLC